MDSDKLKKIVKTDMVIGYRQIVKDVCCQNFRCVVLANDVDALFKNKVTELCIVNNIPIHTFESKEELGKVANIDVPCGVIGILDR